jgi:hypothetical protein
MRTAGKATALILGWALTVSSAGAYYHYIHYTSKTAPYQPVYEKFDLAALPNKTVTMFVSDAGPKKFLPNDNLTSVLTQVRQAAQAWDGVATSDLRVAFGGFYSDGTSGATARWSSMTRFPPDCWPSRRTRRPIVRLPGRAGHSFPSCSPSCTSGAI